MTQFVHQFPCSGTHVVHNGRGTSIYQAINLFQEKEVLWDATNGIIKINTEIMMRGVTLQHIYKFRRLKSKIK